MYVTGQIKIQPDSLILKLNMQYQNCNYAKIMISPTQIKNIHDQIKILDAAEMRLNVTQTIFMLLNCVNNITQLIFKF